LMYPFVDDFTMKTRAFPNKSEDSI
jgi:hypothetical protein